AAPRPRASAPPRHFAAGFGACAGVEALVVLAFPGVAGLGVFLGAALPFGVFALGSFWAVDGFFWGKKSPPGISRWVKVNIPTTPTRRQPESAEHGRRGGGKTRGVGPTTTNAPEGRLKGFRHRGMGAIVQAGGPRGLGRVAQQRA